MSVSDAISDVSYYLSFEGYNKIRRVAKKAEEEVIFEIQQEAQERCDVNLSQAKARKISYRLAKKALQLFENKMQTSFPAPDLKPILAVAACPCKARFFDYHGLFRVSLMQLLQGKTTLDAHPFPFEKY